MPWRLIGFILIFIIFLIFIGNNLGEDYVSDINFGFFKIENVPVFYTIFVSFILGVLITLPIILIPKKKHAAPPPPSNYKPSEKVDNKDNKANNDIADTSNALKTEEQNEPAPSYSGGKYFKKKK